MKHIRIGMEDWAAFEKADTNTFLVLKDLWLMFSDEEKELISKKQVGAGKKDVWAFI